MARPLRIQFPGALYHLIARGNRQSAIFEDALDKHIFLETFGEVVREHDWLCSSYCLMENHYHLVVETRRANLSHGMRQLNGVFTQATNRRHERVGHLFQGRYKAILVDKAAYFLELSRYVVLNPVRAGLVDAPGDWRWSSYRETLDPRYATGWLARDQLLAHFGAPKRSATSRYAEFVARGIKNPVSPPDPHRQIFLGDDDYVAHMQAAAKIHTRDPNIPRAQTQAPAKPLDYFRRQHPTRNAAMIAAYETGEFTYQQIANFFGVHFTTVGRVIRGGRRLAR